MPAAAIAIAAAAIGTVAASRIASSRRNGLAVTWHRVPWSGARRVRVVHLTDLHVGPTTPSSVLRRAVEVVGTLQPDVVALTGDYVNASLFFRTRLTDFVRALPKPCVATLGNHDHFAGPERVTWALQDGGAVVLRNASTVVDVNGEALVVVGVDDGASKKADVELSFDGVAAPERALVLSHFPNTAETIAIMGAPLVLSGHTHAGTVDVPRATRAIARLTGNPYLHGFYRTGPRTHLYVNAGIGHSLPGMRAGSTCPEIAVFELDPTAPAIASCTLRTTWAKTRPYL